MNIILLASIDETVRSIAAMSLACDLGRGIEVRHDLSGQQLRIVASDHHGPQFEREQLLEHGCLSCAVREGLVPTLAWLGEQERWDTALVTLPATASPLQVAWTIEEAVLEGTLPGQCLAHVVSVLDEATLVDDLLGDASVLDRGLALAENDERAIGEALAAFFEASDTIVTLHEPDLTTATLLSHVMAPESMLWHGLAELPVHELIEHESCVTDLPPRWAPDAMPLPTPTDAAGVWTIDLVSPRPFHPGRLHEQVELLGAGRIHARGCFWLPSRPDSLCAWDASGGQVSISTVAQWGSLPRRTHLRVTGIDEAERGRIHRAFDDILLTDHEMRTALARWAGRGDGLEPWLGESRLGEAG